MDPTTLQSPYPGLRPFTEKEAIFFKGREHHISKIQSELLIKRFLMVTGASGDGKSSLVFAGVIPNIRAGFIRGEFGKWQVAVIRPGHKPLENLSREISKAFQIQSYEEILNKLKFGYSALIDLYKSSSLYVDSTSDKFNALDEKEQKKAKRKASNLLLVVDQFEEFFTNDENFNKETAIPSNEAQLTINLLLESTRIATEQNIPLYIICTMRSDYIGNAPAYRGLPELIGKSQFFVPRLNREEISQVIEEPTILSGNKISKRLIQRLINDLNVVNTDVLPSLQHALRQIWNNANKGQEELDLLHYAMAGGIVANDLSKEDEQKFNQWKLSQPEFKQILLNKVQPNKGIGNVLNHHADLLYENIHNQEGLNLPKEKAQKFIQNFYQCLTQIDEGKAIRRRVTFKKALEIIDEKNISRDQICTLLKPYREQGTNFIYPFIDNDDAEIDDNVLLDITHESLIRNWDKLGEWTKAEYGKVTDIKELNTLLYRWLENGKQKGDLLSIGSFNYFITRYPNKLPSKAWMTRYMDQTIQVTDGISLKPLNEDSDELKQQQKENLTDWRKNLRDYLHQSRDEIRRKRRTQKIITTAITILLIFSVAGFIRSNILKNQIEKTAQANEIATRAYATLSTDPTLSFRLAEKAYNLVPTKLSKQVLLESYFQSPFYNSLSTYNWLVYNCIISNNDKYIVSHSKKVVVISNFEGEVIKKIHVNLNNLNGKHSVAIAENSQFIAIATIDSLCILYNIIENKFDSIRLNHKASAIAISNNNNDVIIGGNNGAISLLNILTRDLKKINPHTGFVSLIRWSPNFDYYFTSSHDNTVCVWDRSNRLINKLINCHVDSWLDFDFSPTMNLIAVPSTEGDPIIWNYLTDEKTPLIGHTQQSWSAHFSPDGTKILTSSIDNSIILWNLKGEIIRKFTGHEAKVWDAQFSNDGKYIISCSDDCLAKIWDLKGNNHYTLKGHKSQLYSAKFSNSGKYAVTTAEDYSLKVWNLNSSEKTKLINHFSRVEGLSISKNQDRIVTGGYDYTAKVWSNKGDFITSLVGSKHYAVYTAIFTNDTKYIFTGGGDKKIRVYNLKGEMLDSVTTPQTVWRLFKSTDEQYLCAEYVPTNIEIFDSKLNSIINLNYISEFFFNEYKNQVFVIRNNSLILYDFENQNYTESKLKLQHNSLLTKIIANSTNDIIITSDKSASLYFWKYNDEKYELTRKYANLGSNVAFMKLAPNELNLLTVHEDKSIKVWNIQTGQLISELVGHTEQIVDADFSKNGKMIVSGGYDYSTRVWTIEGKEITVFTGHKGAVLNVEFINNDEYVVSVSNDKTIGLMPISADLVLQKINIEKVRGKVFELDKNTSFN